MRKRLEACFEFAQLETNWRTEILAGFNTFVTMAYIVASGPPFVEPTPRVPRPSRSEG